MLLGGLAAGMVLFIVSVGLSVTMGLMGFVNLAHGGFAMIGGYVIVLAMNKLGIPFVPALALGFIVTAAVSVVFERLLYSRLYRAPELDQVLFTIGLVFIMIAGVTIVVGPETQPLTLPPSMQGQINLGFMTYRTYSIVLIVVGCVIMLGLWLGFERTRMGAQIRAAVDNRRMAESLGINITRLFTITLRVRQRHGGARRRARRRVPRPRSAISAQIPGDVPDRGRGRRARPHHRRVLCGADHRRARLHAEEIFSAGRHGLHLRHDHPAAAVAAAGPVRAAGMSIDDQHDATVRDNPAAQALARRHRFQWWEVLPWLLALGFYFAFPRYLGFGTELLITVLFAISLDLALGYAGIITLGHAAFFGAGAYTVGMLAKHEIWTEPISGLVIAAIVAGAAGFAVRPGAAAHHRADAADAHALHHGAFWKRSPTWPPR